MKQIPDFPNYSVTEDGRVWSHRSNKYIVPVMNGRGYHKVRMQKDGKRWNKAVHRLVALNYLPNPNNKPQINHIDGNKLNNDVTNLEWCTAKENVQHATLAGLNTGVKGSRCNLAVLNEDEIAEIKILLKTTNMYQKDIAERFNVCQQTISDIKRGKSWSHI